MIHRARYNDGKTALSHDVVVKLGLAGLQLEDKAGIQIGEWSYDSLRRLEARGDGKVLRLKTLDRESERLIFESQEILSELAARGCEAPYEEHQSLRGLARTAILGTIGTVVLAVIVWFGFPYAARAMAALLPPSWERALGDQAYTQIVELLEFTTDEELHFCQEEPGRQVLDRLVADFATATNSPYEYRIEVLDFPVVNAFALPGGRIVFFSELIEKADSASEVAGVLAHEMGHVVHRDGTQAMMRSYALSIVIGFVTGDFSGGTLGELGQMVLEMSYSRDAEADADRFAVELLSQEGVTAAGMVDFFSRIKEESGDLPRSLRFLSSHPPHVERIAYFEQADTGADPGLAQDDWEALKLICGEREEEDDEADSDPEEASETHEE
jgi:Zn-dependent protease with chaperone function